MIEKVRKAEISILDFVTKHYLIFLVLAATVLALVVRYKFLGFESKDYTIFLSSWFESLKEGGGLEALGNFGGDYNAPYMTILALLTYLPFSSLYLIKAVSILFDIALAGSAAYLVWTLAHGKSRKFLAAITYVIVLFLPQVMANGALWGQCDSIYATFGILALTFLLKDRYTLSFVLLGLAFAFKLQFVFLLPTFVVVYVVKKRFSIFNFLIIPLVNIILCLPAIIAGKPFWECMMIYANQTQTYNDVMSLNFVSFWNIFNVDPNYWYLAGVALALVVCAIALGFILHYKIDLTQERILTLTIWFMVVVTFLLPGMHERYLYVGEILAAAYLVLYRKNWLIMVLINVYACITYSVYLTESTTFELGTLVAQSGWNYHLLAIVELAAIVIYTQKVFTTKPNTKNELLASNQ